MQTRFCVVTGTNSEVGRAIAQEFVFKGVRVLAIDNESPEDPVKHDLFLRARVDVGDYLGFSSAVRVAEAEYGPITGFVNNAGVMCPADLEPMAATEWKTILDHHLQAIFNGTQIAMSTMKPRLEGTIINVNLMPGLKASRHPSLYHATRCAIRGFTELTWEGLASTGVRCVTIAPDTLEGTIEPEDIAQAVWFAYSRPARVCLKELVIAATR